MRGECQMLQCPNCGRQQELGKFCGNCGTSLEKIKQEQSVKQNIEEEKQTEFNVEKSAEETVEDIRGSTTEASRETNRETQAHETAQQETSATQTTSSSNAQSSASDMQTGLKKYWDYSLNLLKRPGEALHEKEGNFANGLVNMALYALTFALIISSVFNKQVRIFDGVEIGILVRIVFYTFLALAACLLLLVVCLLIAEKISVKKLTFKTIVAQYGCLLVPFIYFHVAIFLFSFFGATLVTILLFNFSIFIVFLILPAIYIYDKTVYYQSTPHKVYTAIGTVLLVLIIFFIAIVVFGMSAMENMLEILDDF